MSEKTNYSLTVKYNGETYVVGRCDCELPIATETTLGGIKVGNNLSITTEGVLSAKDTTYSNATQNASGLMSSSDKTKLDGIPSNAEHNQNAFSNISVGSDTINATSETDTFSVETTNIDLSASPASKKITFALTSENIITALGYTPIKTDTNTSHYHGVGVGLLGSGSDGISGGTFTYKLALQSETLDVNNALVRPASNANRIYPLILDKSGKLATIVPWTDTTFTLEQATSGALGGVKIGYTNNAKNYAVELDTNGKMFVNVPWENTIYVLPQANNTSLGGVKIGYTPNGKNYAIELDTDGKMFVNVPWEDTEYTLPTASKNTLGGIKVDSGVDGLKLENETLKVDTSTIATKEEVNAKLDTETYNTYVETTAPNTYVAKENFKANYLDTNDVFYTTNFTATNIISTLGDNAVNKATKDGEGNVINTTYAKKADISDMVTISGNQTITGVKTFSASNKFTSENTFTHATYAPTWSDIANGIGKSSCFTRGAFMQLFTGQIMLPNAKYSESTKGYNTESGKLKIQTYTTSGGQPTNPTDIAVFSADGLEIAGTITANGKQVATTETATTSANGLMSSADKSKLDNIEENANNYVLPTASSNAKGGVKVDGNGLVVENEVLKVDETIALKADLTSKLDTSTFNTFINTTAPSKYVAIENFKTTYLDANSVAYEEDFEDYYNKSTIDTKLASKANTSDIPTNNNQLVNGANYITKEVNDLTYYYTITQINSIVETIKKGAQQVVEEKPSDPTEGVIYLVGSDAPYELWIYEDGKGWIYLGKTTIDLTGYVKGSNLTADKVILGNGSSNIKVSSYAITTSLGTDNTTIPTSLAVKTAIENAKYTLPKATTSTLGGIIVGSNLTITEDGVLSAVVDSFELNAATATALGGIKIGYAENAKNYAVKLDSNNKAYVSVPWTDTTYTLPLMNASTRGGAKIGYTQNGKNYPVELSNEQMFVNVPWTDTIYTLEVATSDKLGGVKVGYTSSGKNYAVQLDTNNKMFVNVPWTDTDTKYTLPTMSATEKGGAKVGNGLAIESDTLNVDTSVVATQTDLDTKVNKSGDTMTGTLVAPIIQTGTSASNYFQSQKFRGQGDASTYYHAVDFGYNNHNQVDFYEYGGIYNFWKNISAAATSDTSNRVASLQLGKLVERSYTLTYPGKSGTIALTSDIKTYDNATTSASGLMSASDKTKLDGIAENANNYSLPIASATTLGGIKIGTNLSIDANGVLSSKDTTYTLPIATSDNLGGAKIGYTENNKNYAVKLDSNNKMYVSVPWTDTDTTYTFTPNNPTLAWGTTSTIGTIGGQTFKVTMPSNPNIDTHYTTMAYIGAKDAKSNAATANGSTYLKVYDNSTLRSQFLVKGSGATSVVSDASGNVEIKTPIDNSTITSGANGLEAHPVEISIDNSSRLITLNIK